MELEVVETHNHPHLEQTHHLEEDLYTDHTCAYIHLNHNVLAKVHGKGMNSSFASYGFVMVTLSLIRKKAEATNGDKIWLR